MLDIHRTDTLRNPKIYFSHSILPSYIDAQNTTTKKQPFSTFNNQHFTHTLHLVLPAELWETVRLALDNNAALSHPQYCRVHMKLSEILEEDFLTTYIKQGNIMMLSKGRPLIDNCFSLYGGTLHMELDRATYERCGLQGLPIEDGGKKHQKQRWVIDYDLTAASMKHGKRGFGRLQWACKNVLNHSLTWVFHNFNPSFPEALAEGREAICKHAPWTRGFAPSVREMDKVLVSRIVPGELPSLYDQDEALELLEYLHVLHLGSPRVNEGDSIDSLLSRYEVPAWNGEPEVRKLVQVSWKGFMAPVFAREVFLLVRELKFRGMGEQEEGHVRRGKEEAWFAMSAQGFGGQRAWTLMHFASRDTLVWDMEA